MIQKIDHRSNSNAEKLKIVFQRSYKVEAQLLGAKNFPPLSRTLSSYKESNNDFFGFYDHDRLTAVIEMKNEKVVNEETAILQFGGGCQGCGMVDLTLKDGVEKTLLEQVEGLKNVKDVTDHSYRENAYYK